MLATVNLSRAQKEADAAHDLLDSARLRWLEIRLNGYAANDTYTAIAARRLNVAPEIVESAVAAKAASGLWYSGCHSGCACRARKESAS